MKSRSIQFKFLTTLIAAMLAVSIFIGGVSVYEVDQFVQRQTDSFVTVTCENEATQVNSIFSDMEKAVSIMSGYVLDYFEDEGDFKNRETQKKVIEASERMFADVADKAPGAVAYYIRLAPEISDSKTGFFFTKMAGSEEYTRFEATDLSLYDKNDTEHVGWYWQPYDAGKPVWMQPYENKNTGITMISYVVPLYDQDQFIGVVGMDFDYTVLVEKVHNFKIYENGFAHLEVDGKPLHNEEQVHAYTPEKYLQKSEELLNGMTLVLSASYGDIRQIRYNISLRILIIVAILAVAFSAVATYMAKRIVKPLQELTDASKKLADGDYDVTHVRSDTYEIQLLSTAFENMSMHLREHEKIQHLLAYRDSLTGLRNTTSYKVWVSDFNQDIQNRTADFGVIVLDLNYLKETNDQYGHDVGNKLIVAVAQLISRAFKRSPVFRIGGDEFLVILQNRDFADREVLCQKLNLDCANQHVDADGKEIPISIAMGFAKFEPETDTQFVDVFNRADDAMYKNKRSMKTTQAR